MDPDIKNFSEIEKLIRENPKEADARYFEWQQFLKANVQSSPELYSIEASEEFYGWAKEHPEKNVDPSVWVGKEISEAYYYLREQHEDTQMRENGGIDRSVVPQDLMSVPLLAAAFLQKPKTMQEDKNYQKTEERLRKEWLKNHNAKDFLSKEGVDYLYGSLDDTAKTSISKETEDAFRNNPKFKKRIERYDKETKKTYKNHDSDPQWLNHERNTRLEINDRLALLGKTSEKSQQEIIQRVQKKHREEFTRRHPEKARVYFEKIEAETIKREEKEKKSSSNSPNIRKLLDELRKSEMPPTQRPSFSERPSFGQSFNRGLNQVQRGATNVARGGSRIASQAGRAAAQAGRVAAQAATRGIMAFFATPPGWITLGVIVGVLVIVFLIVFIMGRDKQTTQQATLLEASPSATLSPIAPSEQPTTPAEP